MMLFKRVSMAVLGTLFLEDSLEAKVLISMENLHFDGQNSQIRVRINGQLIDNFQILTLKSPLPPEVPPKLTLKSAPLPSPSPHLSMAHIEVLKELKSKFAPKAEKVVRDLDIDLTPLTDAIYKTATGSYLKYMFPGEDLETSIESACKAMFQKLVKNKSSQHRLVSEDLISRIESDYEGTLKQVVSLARKIIASSVSYGEGYDVFYHGHGNGLRLYLDMLKEIRSFEIIKDLNQTNPLRDKSLLDPVSSTDDIFEKYENAALEFAKENNLNLYDEARGLGVGFAPDKTDFARTHLLSANINLFGNMNNLGECTLFYFLDSFNISNPNEALLKSLLQRISPKNISEEALQKKIERYTNLYNATMKETGGNLLQILVKRTLDENGTPLIDKVSFPAWMKGIPVWLDKRTKTLATRGGNNKALPLLKNEPSDTYTMATTSKYMDLFVNKPKAFLRKYSAFPSSKRVRKADLINVIDRPQVRLITNSVLFCDEEKVKINQFTRFNTSEEALAKYQNGLKELLREDLEDYLHGLNNGSIQGHHPEGLNRLVKFMKNRDMQNQ